MNISAKLFALILGSILVTALRYYADGKNAGEAIDLLDRALERENIWATGLPAIGLHAQLEVAAASSHLAAGDYKLLWISPSQSK